MKDGYDRVMLGLTLLLWAGVAWTLLAFGR
jgi:hypothetical protein